MKNLLLVLLIALSISACQKEELFTRDNTIFYITLDAQTTQNEYLTIPIYCSEFKLQPDGSLHIMNYTVCNNSYDWLKSYRFKQLTVISSKKLYCK